MREPWNELTLPDLYRSFAETGLVGRLIELARDEDLGPGLVDLTGAATPGETHSRVILCARESGVLSGLAAVPEILEVFGVALGFTPSITDGDRFEPGDQLAIFTGPLADIVKVERTILNLVSRLSGIATRTDSFVRTMDTNGPHRARLYDTRKTTPGLRLLEKYAVRCGGGFCHRLGLHDAVMFKDNHIAGISPDDLADHALKLARAARDAAAIVGIVPAFIEFEVDSLQQLCALLTLPAGTIDIVLLDNMNPPLLSRAVGLRDKSNPSLRLEASGGIGLDTIAQIAQTGVDRISVGGLTHQAVSLDLGFDSADESNGT